VFRNGKARFGLSAPQEKPIGANRIMTKALKHGDTTKSRFLIIRPSEPLPTRISALVASEGIKPIVVVFGGGNNGLTDDIKAGMPAFFSGAFAGFNGTAISGGTGKFDEAGVSTSFEITTVPPLLAEENDCIAIGMTPATAEPSLSHGNGSVNVDDWGGKFDPRHHANLYVANHPSDKYLGWDGDLDKRFIFLEELLEQGYTVGYVIFNGGDVTTKEIYRALDLTAKGLQLFVVEGSGREADKFIAAYRDGKVSDTNAKGNALDTTVAADYANSRANADKANVTIVPVGDVTAFRSELIARGVIVA
jgi:hypothetical protein